MKKEDMKRIETTPTDRRIGTQGNLEEEPKETAQPRGSWTFFPASGRIDQQIFSCEE